MILPWRPGCPHREAALSWVLPRWEDTGWQVVVAEQPGGGAWCKAAAVEAGLADATGDVLVVADADVWCDGIGAAVDAR
ncbi:MAG UNVERIFIED_CONTAM: glycosyltransferase, partial [Thermobifida fusca]